MRCLLSLFPLLILLTGCPEGEPCTWTVSNETGEELTSLRFAEQGRIFGENVLAGVPLPVSEEVAFDVDGATTYDLQGFAGEDQFLRLEAAHCYDGEALETTLVAFDRQI